MVVVLVEVAVAAAVVESVGVVAVKAVAAAVAAVGVAVAFAAAVVEVEVHLTVKGSVSCMNSAALSTRWQMALQGPKRRCKRTKKNNKALIIQRCRWRE